MTRKLKWVLRDVDRYGNVRYYFRRPGFPKVRLTGNPAEELHLPSYDNAVAGLASVSDLHKKSNANGYIYFLRSGQFVKIGYSTRPMYRLEAIKTGLAMRLDVAVAFPGTRSDEQALHEKFSKYRIEGEWFRVVPAIIQAMSTASAYGALGLHQEQRDDIKSPTVSPCDFGTVPPQKQA